MRITHINLSNFRAFATPPGGISIPLPKGENLLVYGENGAGKSSLFLALKYFFEAGGRKNYFAPFQNHFHSAPNGAVRLDFSNDAEEAQPTELVSWTWSEDFDSIVPDGHVYEANRCKAFIDYKVLLSTYFLPKDEGQINFFPLLIGEPSVELNLSKGGLLANIRNDVSKINYYENWIYICAISNGRRTQRWRNLVQDRLDEFNNGLRAELDELSKLASTYLQFFGYNIKFEFEFGGLAIKDKIKVPTDDVIRLHLEFFDSPIENHHEFLNEAKLSALALSIFLAAHKRQPKGAIKILAFDDVLIGLDMSNRLPFLDLLKEHFSEYQIVLTTYDRSWFEIVRARTRGDGWPTGWKTVEMFVGKAADFESPVVKTDEKTLLQLAHDFFDVHLYKAAAVYARTHFEHLLKNYCSDRRLAVAYHENPKKMSSNDFWLAIKGHKCTETQRIERFNGKRELIKVEEKPYQVPLIAPDLVRQVEEARDLFLNPLSHSGVTSPLKSEIEKSLAAIAALEKRLGEA